MIFGKWVELEGRAWHGFLYLLLWVVGLEFSKIITKDKRPKRLAWFLVLCRREGGGRGGVGGLRPLEAMLPQSSDDGRQETIGKISDWSSCS